MNKKDDNIYKRNIKTISTNFTNNFQFHKFPQTSKSNFFSSNQFSNRQKSRTFSNGFYKNKQINSNEFSNAFSRQIPTNFLNKYLPKKIIII